MLYEISKYTSKHELCHVIDLVLINNSINRANTRMLLMLVPKVGNAGSINSLNANRPGHDSNANTLCVLVIEKALADCPTYTKALLRRAQANEKIGEFSPLSSAL